MSSVETGRLFYLILFSGKTGTGDHRTKVCDVAGRLVRERVVNRTATIVFFIGDRFYGTVSAYVPGEDAASFSLVLPRSPLPVPAGGTAEAAGPAVAARCQPAGAAADTYLETACLSFLPSSA